MAAKKKATKRILLLIGTPTTTKVFAQAEPLWQMYSTAAKLRKMHFIIRLNKSFQSDLLWWHTFLQAWNGFSILRHPAISTQIFVPKPMHWEHGASSRASPPLVTVAMTSEYWNHGQGAGANHSYLYYLPYLSRRHINFQCDNANLVISINKGSCKDKLVMHLLTSCHFRGSLWYISYRFSSTRINQCYSQSSLPWQFASSISNHSQPIPEPTPATFCPPIAITSQAGLDFSSLAELFQQTLSFVSQQNSWLCNHAYTICLYDHAN